MNLLGLINSYLENYWLVNLKYHPYHNVHAQLYFSRLKFNDDLVIFEKLANFYELKQVVLSHDQLCFIQLIFLLLLAIFQFDQTCLIIKYHKDDFRWQSLILHF
jgi:hypothetical protein